MLPPNCLEVKLFSELRTAPGMAGKDEGMRPRVEAARPTAKVTGQDLFGSMNLMFDEEVGKMLSAGEIFHCFEGAAPTVTVGRGHSQASLKVVGR